MTTDLVIQAPTLDGAKAARIAAVAGARAIVPIGDDSPIAYRLPDIAVDPALLADIQAAGCDAAFVPRDQRRDRVGVVALDMDSTLITIECIDEIADLQGIKPEVAAITASAMRGEIEFAESLRRRVCLLQGLPLTALAHVYDDRLQLSPGAERMLAGFRAAGARTAVLSGGFTFFTDRLQRRLALDYALSNVFEVADGRLTGRVSGALVDAQAKADALDRLRAQWCSGGKLAVAIGDGANDLPMFERADVAIAYRAKAVVRARAQHALDVCGLDGALNYFN